MLFLLNLFYITFDNLNNTLDFWLVVAIDIKMKSMKKEKSAMGKVVVCAFVLVMGWLMFVSAASASGLLRLSLKDSFGNYIYDNDGTCGNSPSSA